MKLDLNDIKNRLRTRSALAITVETGRLAVSLMRCDDKETQVLRSFSIPFGDEDVLKRPDAVGQELAAALSAAGIRERRCVVCLPPGWALTASADLPEIGAEDLRGYLELRAEREFSIPAGDLKLGYCAYSLPNGQRRATLAALPAKKIEAIGQMLRAAHREGTSISLALDKVLSQPQAMIHFLTNGNHTDVVVTAGGGIAGLRSLPNPWAAGDAMFESAAFCRDVRITLGRLPEAVRLQVRRAEFGGPSAKKLCVATRYNLLRMGIESPECENFPATAELPPDAAGAAADTAMRHLRDQEIPFEFVVPEVKRWQQLFQRFDTTGRRRLVYAAAAFVLLPILILFIRSEYESHLENQWAAMERSANDLGDLQQKIHQFRPWFEPVPQGLQLLESLATAFPAQGDVWAKSIQVAEGYKVTCTGFARTQPALMALMDRMRARSDITALQLQQIRGENPIQFSVTYQWEEQHDR